jgi:hypothetical protein
VIARPLDDLGFGIERKGNRFVHQSNLPPAMADIASAIRFGVD